MRRRIARWRSLGLAEKSKHCERQWCWARCLLLVLLACCVLLPLLAFASPPDPVWIPGIYHLADYDDVIVALTNLDAVDDSSPTTLPLLHAGDRALPSGPASVLTNASVLLYQPRSPPTICFSPRTRATRSCSQQSSCATRCGARWRTSIRRTTILRYTAWFSSDIARAAFWQGSW